MPRLAETIQPLSLTSSAPAIAILGLPDDTGVGLNQGHQGAAEGPRAFRQALAGYATSEAIDWPVIYDAGDVPPNPDIEQTHHKVSERAHQIAAMGLTPVAIGGGHDLTFAFVRGVQCATPIASGVYFDAHLDVRENIGSGMPFRRLIQDCAITDLTIHGLDPNANSREHTDYFLERGGRIASSDIAEPWPDTDRFVSFDLDVIDMAFAPGVSARNPAGWSSREAIAWAERAGSDTRTRCFDIMELCPPRDESERTARLAAAIFVAFCRGFADRSRP